MSAEYAMEIRLPCITTVRLCVYVGACTSTCSDFACTTSSLVYSRICKFTVVIYSDVHVHSGMGSRYIQCTCIIEKRKNN